MKKIFSIMSLPVFVITSNTYGNYVKAIGDDGKVRVIDTKSAYRLTSQSIYYEEPKLLKVADEVIKGYSIGININSPTTINIPVKNNQIISFIDINAKASFSGSCKQNTDSLICEDGNLTITSNSSDGKLILISKNYPLVLPQNSYYLGTGSTLSNRSGNGVIIAIVDTGIDICHPEFEDRIIYYYDATTGEEFDINKIRELRRKGECIKDFSGHGTSVAGIAAGKTTGIAPKSEIIAVKVVSNDGYIRDTDLIRGIEYVVNKKKQLNKPVVLNISLSNNFGPADGTGLLDKYIDSISNNGLIPVVAVGNSGDKPVRAIINPSTSSQLRIRLSQQVPIEVWYDNGSKYKVEICDYNNNCAVSTQTSFSNTNLPCVYSAEHKDYPLNNRKFVSIEHNCSGNFNLKISLIDGSPSKVDIFAGFFPENAVFDYNIPDGKNGYFYTVGQPATGNKIISVGALTSRAVNYGSLAYKMLGDLAPFSSRGPTTDGRIKPDIVAGGYVVYTTEIGGGYTYEYGTSFATPAVSGIVALMLQDKYNLNVDEVKQALCGNALKDYITGFSLPNNFYGCGKVYGGFLYKISSNDSSSGAPVSSNGSAGGGCNLGGANLIYGMAIASIFIVFRRFRLKR